MASKTHLADYWVPSAL